MLVDAARRDLTWRSRRGIGNVVASLLVWVGLSLLALIVREQEKSAVIYLASAVLLWPLSLVSNRLLSRGQLTKDNPLFRLPTLSSALHVIFLPLIVGTYLTAPHMLPLYLSILLGAQFLLYIWVYDSLAYLFGSLGVVEVAILMGWLAPGATYLVTPFMVAGILLVTTIFLLSQARYDEQTVGHN